MLSALCFAALGAVPIFAPPQPWALNFAAPPRIPLVGDVDNDGYADLICVYPEGEAIIDVSLNVDGMKAGFGFQGLTKWGKGCEAAVAGELDDKPGADVAGLFNGDSVLIAGGYKDRKFASHSELAKLPKKLDKPFFQDTPDGSLVVISSTSGDAFEIDLKDRSVSSLRFPKGLMWAAPNGRVVRNDGSIAKFHDGKLDVEPRLAKLCKESKPALSSGGLLTGNDPASKEWLRRFGCEDCPDKRFFGDIDKDGDEDIIIFRYGQEKHSAFNILVSRAVSEGEKDSDNDGLSNEDEAKLKTDALIPDTDNDGLLDGWEIGTVRGLDLKDLGCNPLKIDLICFVSRFHNTDEAHIKKELDRVKKTYSELNAPNPDGSLGWNFHPIYLEPVKEAEAKRPWWENREAFLKSELRGIAHWMQISQGGGGQADQLGDGGGCGSNALWAVFLHEFGHQIGMDHDGFWGTGLCPIYGSLMNYAYSYSYEDDGNKIHYSDGRLKGYVLNETNLDEEIPLPYDQVKFLEKGPYRWKIKPNGNTTLIDWNWNGIFGEKGIRADINYSYSTNAGARDEIDKIHSSPWLFTHEKSAYALYGKHSFPADPKTDPTVSAEKPGALILRRMIEPKKWDKPFIVESGGLIGDPVGISHDGWIYLFYATRQGVVMRRVEQEKGKLSMSDAQVVDPNPKKVPTVGQNGKTTYLFLWDPDSGEVTYRTVARGLKLSRVERLYLRSTIPVGMAVDSVKKQVIIGLAQDQDERRPSRWQIRRFNEAEGRLTEVGMEWIEGEAGQARGTGRCRVLFLANKDTGPQGRIYFFGRGMTSKETPWACTYVAETIADKATRGGWMVKRYYDEWTQTRSAPAATWFNNDILWAYRWVDGGQTDRDNLFHVGYNALGIQDEDMGDHDDLTYFRTFGIRHSIMYMNK